MIFNPLMTIDDMAREHTVSMLEHHNGDKTLTAEALGITLKTLYNRLHQYGLFEKYRQCGVSHNENQFNDGDNRQIRRDPEMLAGEPSSSPLPIGPEIPA